MFVISKHDWAEFHSAVTSLRASQLQLVLICLPELEAALASLQQNPRAHVLQGPCNKVVTRWRQLQKFML
jgi:hypothetical protein